MVQFSMGPSFLNCTLVVQEDIGKKGFPFTVQLVMTSALRKNTHGMFCLAVECPCQVGVTGTWHRCLCIVS